MNARQTQRIRRNVSDGTAFKRHNAARRHIQEIREDLERLAQRMAELRRQYARWHEHLTGEVSRAEELPARDVTLHLRARRLLFAAVLVLVLEMGLAGFIASSWLNFSKPVAALVGAVLAAILAAIADVLMGLMEDPENPRTSEALIKGWARWLTVSCLAVLTAICLTRFFDVGAVVFPWASGLLTILLPATAGSYLTLRSLLETGNQIADVWMSLDDEVRQTRILRDEMDTQLEELRGRVAMEGGNEGPGARPGEDRGPRAATWLLVGLLLWGLMGGSVAQAAWAEPWNGEAVQVWIDVSGSLDGEESRKTVAEMKRTLTKLVRQPGSRVRRVDLYAWSSAADALRGPAHSFHFPPLPGVHCEPPRPASETEKILRGPWEQRKQKAEQECRARQQRARASHEQSLSPILGSFSVALDRVLARQGAPQTCFFQVLSRVARAPAGSLVLLLTDAEHSNCGMPSAPRATTFKPGGRVYVVLVPARAVPDDAFQHLDARARQIQNFLPSARVVPSHEVNGSLEWLAVQR